MAKVNLSELEVEFLENNIKIKSDDSKDKELYFEEIDIFNNIFKSCKK